MRHQRVDLVGAERVGKIVWSDLLVRSGADPRLGLVVEAGLLQLLEEIVQAAAQNAAGGAACEQASEPTLEQVCKPAARLLSRDDFDIAAGRLRPGAASGGRRLRLPAAKAFHRLVGKKTQYRHGDRRHARAAGATAATGASAAHGRG